MSPHVPPPRQTAAPSDPTTSTLPLAQLWTQLPQHTREQFLSQLTRMLEQRLVPAEGEEPADE